MTLDLRPELEILDGCKAQIAVIEKQIYQAALDPEDKAQRLLEAAMYADNLSSASKMLTENLNIKHENASAASPSEVS